MSAFQNLINGKKPVLVDFFATWCGPCKMMAPILTDLKQQVGEAATVIKIDIDKNRDAASSYQVQSVPTLILFKEGKVLWRKSGVIQASELKQVIQQHA